MGLGVGLVVGDVDAGDELAVDGRGHGEDSPDTMPCGECELVDDASPPLRTSPQADSARAAIASIVA